jgi:hypothetical protein
MIISMIGSPRSGKTTTAARVFSHLKEASFSCEYIPEQARMVIAEKRAVGDLKPTDQLTLTDHDQYVIMCRQLELQRLMSKACGEDSIIVTDSSPLNALLYMSPEYRNQPAIKMLTTLALDGQQILFYAKPVPWLGGLDPNRIHDKTQSDIIDSQIPQVIFPLLPNQPSLLLGDIDLRWRTAVAEVLRSIMKV